MWAERQKMLETRDGGACGDALDIGNRCCDRDLEMVRMHDVENAVTTAYVA
jgi:hypothetical protein